MPRGGVAAPGIRGHGTIQCPALHKARHKTGHGTTQGTTQDRAQQIEPRAYHAVQQHGDVDIQVVDEHVGVRVLNVNAASRRREKGENEQEIEI